MSIVIKYQTHKIPSSELIIQTHRQQWVIPHSANIMKALLQDQAILPTDLQFDCNSDCQSFIKKLLVLALEDEYKNKQPSPLAKLARALIYDSSQ